MSAALITGDPDWASVAFLLHCDGGDQSTNVIEEKGKTVTLAGNAKLTTHRRVLGEASLRLDGTGAWVDIGTAADAKFLHDGSSYTVEFWACIDSFAAAGVLFCTSNGSSINVGCYCGFTTTRQLSFQIYRGVDSSLVLDWTSSANVWPDDDLFHFVQIVYDATQTPDKASVYLDGTLLAQPVTINPNATSNPTAALRLGALANNLTPLRGNIAGFRATNGVIRSDGVPTAQWPGQYKARYTGTITESLPPVDWLVSVHRADTGEVLGSQVTSSGSYSIDVDYTGPCLVMARPDMGGVWQASKAVALDDLVFATDTITTPHFWKCTTAGTTGGAEPTWNLSDTTNDGTAVWTYVGSFVQAITHGPLVPV